VVQDADEHSVEQVSGNLDDKIEPARTDDEPIAYIIPKWHIQTWIAYLNHENVDETDKEIYKNKYGRLSESKDAHPFIDELADDCRNNRELESPPDSLIVACKEFERIRNALKRK
jgi:hypothetical protein